MVHARASLQEGPFPERIGVRKVSQAASGERILASNGKENQSFGVDV